MTMQRTLWLIAHCAMVIALASFITTPRGSSDADTIGCPKGKVLFSIMDTDGTYKPVCIPASAGGMK